MNIIQTYFLIININEYNIDLHSNNKEIYTIFLRTDYKNKYNINLHPNNKEIYTIFLQTDYKNKYNINLHPNN